MNILKTIGKGMCWLLSVVLKLAGGILKIVFLLFMLLCRLFIALVKIATP